MNLVRQLKHLNSAMVGWAKKNTVDVGPNYQEEGIQNVLKKVHTCSERIIYQQNIWEIIVMKKTWDRQAPRSDTKKDSLSPSGTLGIRIKVTGLSFIQSIQIKQKVRHSQPTHKRKNISFGLGQKNFFSLIRSNPARESRMYYVSGFLWR